ncbi:MAG: TolC family protein [Chitinophagales bacterium]|jgi:outer membrane protein TolC|nr:TolC family protein [Chitinophagales bacterium]
MEKFWIMPRLLFFLMLCPLGLFGQDTLYLSLEKAIEIAMKENLTIKQTEIQNKVAHLNIKRAENRFLPSINASGNGGQIWGRGIDPLTNSFVNSEFRTLNAGIQSNLNLFNGFQDIENLKIQKNAMQANLSRRQQQENDVLIEVTNRFLKITFIKQSIALADSQLGLAKKNEWITQERIRQGNLPKNEQFKLIAQVKQEEANLLDIKNQLNLENLHLSQLLNLKADNPIIITQLSSFDLDTTQIDYYIIRALAKNLPINTRKLEAENAKKQIKIARSGLMPKLDLGFGLNTSYSSVNPFLDFRNQIDNNLSKVLSLNLNVPIFNQFQVKNQIHEAKLNAEIAQVQVEQEVQVQTRQLLSLKANIQNALARKDMQEASMLASEAAYFQDASRFEIGRINVNELNLSKQNYFNAQRLLLNAKNEVIALWIQLMILSDSIKP